MSLSEKKWFDLVNLFDINLSIKYTIIDKLFLQKDIEGYLNDKYLVDAFDEVDKNLVLLDNPSKFIFLIRIRDGIRLMYENFKIVYPNKKNKDVLLEEFATFQRGKRWLKENGINEPDGLNKEYFIKFYNSLFLLHYNIEIELNELISRVPLQSIKSEEINLKSNLKRKLEQKKEFINNYYITGGKNVISNSIESIVFSPDDDIKHNIEPLEIIKTICIHFKSLIENNGLYKLIYENDKVSIKHENVPQKLFFSISQVYCIANNIDVSPETNSGAGSVDFKFSVGFKQKVNVELKYSKNPKLIDGFKLQIEAYNRAEKTDKSFYIVLNVDDNSKLDDLLVIFKEEKSKNKKLPELIIIDSKYKESASKLKNNTA
ncbi:hypothetical protein [Aquimarina rubra]|uniref:Uncharacterized protein n=1 Tax=Aquimarina rubra TaxID=1920033 RepID=A0ABW5LCL0_9FLAO